MVRKEENNSWLPDLKKMINLLSQLRSSTTPGFYLYSLSGDLFNERTKWGLGNAVFATKIYTMLGANDTKRDAKIIHFIKSFQQANGYFFDPLIQKLTLAKRIKKTFTTLKIQPLLNEETKRAETRQAWAALACLQSKPNTPFPNIPQTVDDVRKYLENLDWTHPWHAGSHFSHLLFFLHYNNHFFPEYADIKKTNGLVDEAIAWVNAIQSKQDGSWYKGSPTLSQKINGAMKVLTGLQAAKHLTFDHAEKLIDLCLGAVNNEQACDNFNIIYVLYCCNAQTSYRHKEIEDFCRKRLDIYKEYYWPELGGFSFYKGKANTSYYGATITKGLAEPDIHGTVMFLWGITLISKILKLPVKLTEPIT